MSRDSNLRSSHTHAAQRRRQARSSAGMRPLSHVEQVLRRVVQVAAIIHVDVSRAAPPARLRNPLRGDQPQCDFAGLIRFHFNGGRRRLSPRRPGLVEVSPKIARRRAKGD